MAEKSRIILVVDDDSLVRAVICDFLREDGHQVLEAADGFEAVNVLTANPTIELVFLDIRMPHLDGIGVLTKMKAMRPDVKIVMITAYVDDDVLYSTIARQDQANADGFMAKPMSMDSLHDCLEMIFEKGKKYIASTSHMGRMARRHVNKPS